MKHFTVVFWHFLNYKPDSLCSGSRLDVIFIICCKQHVYCGGLLPCNQDTPHIIRAVVKLEFIDCEIVKMKSNLFAFSLVTSSKHTHVTHIFTHTCSYPSEAQEIKVLMSSLYQQRPSWPCHQWLAWSQRKGLVASPFKDFSPAAAAPQIPSLDISLCYIYYLHLDNILSDCPFFPFSGQIAVTLKAPAFGISRGVETVLIPSSVFLYLLQSAHLIRCRMTLFL